MTNGQCTVNAAGSSAGSVGNTLTLMLNMSFTGAFDGNRVIYLAARDSTDANNSGWQSVGSWTVAVGAASPESAISPCDDVEFGDTLGSRVRRSVGILRERRSRVIMVSRKSILLTVILLVWSPASCRPPARSSFRKPS